MTTTLPLGGTEEERIRAEQELRQPMEQSQPQRTSVGQIIAVAPHEAAHATEGPPTVDAIFGTSGVFVTEHQRGSTAIPQAVPTNQGATDSFLERRWNVSGTTGVLLKSRFTVALDGNNRPSVTTASTQLNWIRPSK